MLPGVVSHTSLLTNLANRAQPLIRYDVGDAIMVRPEPCECGSLLPAIRVHGRSHEILRFEDQEGKSVYLDSMAILHRTEDVPGVVLSQFFQTPSRELRVRLEIDPGCKKEQVWQRVVSMLSTLLADNGLPDLDLELDPTPIELPTDGRKLQLIFPANSEVRGEEARQPT